MRPAPGSRLSSCTRTRLAVRNLVLAALVLVLQAQAHAATRPTPTRAQVSRLDAALVAAIEQGDDRRAAELLKHGDEANAKDDYGTPVLHLAAGRGDLPLLKILLQYGAGINTRDDAGDTPAVCAAHGAHLEVTKWLLAAGGDAYDRKGHSLRAWKSQPAKLAEAAYRALVPTDWDVCPNFLIPSDSGTAIVATLLGADPRSREALLPVAAAFPDPSAWSFQGALKNDHSGGLLVRLLLDRGAPVNGRARGVTALMWSAERQDLATVRLLLDRGADPNLCAEGVPPALCFAIERGGAPVVQLLLDRGADPKVHYLVFKAVPYPEILRMLLDRGADPNDRPDGRPALEAAVEDRNVESVKLLLEKGADPRDPQIIHTALNGAARHMTDPASAAILNLLRKAGASD